MNPYERHRLIGELAKTFRGPILVQPFPMPSERSDEPAWKIKLLYGERRGEVMAYCYGVTQELMREHVRRAAATSTSCRIPRTHG